MALKSIRLNISRNRIFFLILILSFFNACAKNRQWNEATVPDLCIVDLIAEGDHFLAIANDSTYQSHLLTSTDANLWETQTIPVMNVQKIKWLNSQYVITFKKYSENKMSFYVSSDGASWVQMTDTVDLNYFMDLIWDGARYIAVGETGNLSTSTDLSSWIRQSLSTPDLKLNSIQYLNNVYWSFGSLVTSYTDSLGTPYDEVGPIGLYSSSDGINWNFDPFFQDKTITGIMYGNGEYVAFGTAGSIYTSTDGLSWTNHSIFLGPSIVAINWTGQDYIATIEDNGKLEIWNTKNFASWYVYRYYNSYDSGLSDSSGLPRHFTTNTSGIGKSIAVAFESDTTTSAGPYFSCKSYVLSSE